MEAKVLPSNSVAVAAYLKDFRVQENGARYAARVQGEGKFLNAAQTAGVKQVLVEFLPEAIWRESRPPLLMRWLIAFRLPYLAFSLLPLFLAFCAYHSGDRFQHLRLGILVIIATSLLHIGCNLWGDYEDHLRGVDAPNSSGGSGAIRKLWIPAVHMRNAAALFFLLEFFIGFSLLFFLSWQNSGVHLLWIGLLGSLAAAGYSGWPFHYKYLGLGEPVIFLVSGPLISLGACAVFFQTPRLFLWFSLASLPLSFLAILRLHTGNLQRIPFDTMAGTRTIANMLGFRKAKYIYAFLLLAPYFTVLALVLSHITAYYPLLVFLSLPLTLFPLKALREAKGPLDPLCQEFRLSAARLQWVFGILYCLGFLF